MAEGTGFEPAIRHNPYNGLANRRLQPLGHPSTEEWIRHGACGDSFTGRASFRQTKPRTLLVRGPKKARSSENFKQHQPIIRRRGRRGTMNLSKRSIEMLLDLVEIKLSYMDISDREDARDMQVLERCRSELQSLDREPESVGAFVRPIRRPGRPRTAA